jgi:predicted nucleic acid-binding protein
VPSRVVIDASALVRLFDGTLQGWVPSAAGDMHAPEILDTEVLGAIRGAVLRGRFSTARGEAMLRDYVALPIVRHRHVPLIPRAWELRHNIVVADAMYVALAEMLDASLVTADARLARAARSHTSVRVLP